MAEKYRSRLGACIRHLRVWAILALCAFVPAWFARLHAAAPQTRDIHIEAFRYGFSPARIHVNRGDLLRLTFSTRDTGQSVFLQDYDVYVVITPGAESVDVHKLSRPDEPPVRMRVVELTAGLPGWRGALVSKSQFRNHTYNGPLHGTERGDIVVAPNYLLCGSLGLLCGLPFTLILARRDRALRSLPINAFELFPRLKRLMKRPSLQFELMVPMLAVFYFVILAGLLGSKVAGRNAGPMVIWVLWLSGLIILLVPLGGRIWCLACPLPSIGEWLQRRRLVKILPGLALGAHPSRLKVPLWPRWLRNRWPSVLLILLLGTFSSALVALPPATSWLLIGLALVPVATFFFSEQRLFCRFVCPINSFISLYSMAGRLAIRSVSAQTCSQCEDRFCLTGSAKGWGCPYGLCMGEVQRNNDCGMCTECIKTCAYDNVALFWRRSGWDREVPSHGEAWQAIVMFGLSITYCVVNLGAWDRVRDWLDIVDRMHWRTFGLCAAGIWVVCLGVLPLMLFLLTRAGIWASGSRVRAGELFRASSASVMPIGLSCWMAFAVAMLSSMMTFVLQSLSDPFNWGWNLLGMAGSRWHIWCAAGLPWLQVACVVTGLVYSSRTLLCCWRDAVSDARRAVAGLAPLACFLWSAAAGMIWFFAG